MTGLDPDIPSPPYQCGRMFAVLEDIQRSALGREVNITIADKYLPAAMATPLAILTMLFAPKGIWGYFAQRYPIALFPLRRRLVRSDELRTRLAGYAEIIPKVSPTEAIRSERDRL